jgi:hypothetical protein
VSGGGGGSCAWAWMMGSADDLFTLREGGRSQSRRCEGAHLTRKSSAGLRWSRVGSDPSRFSSELVSIQLGFDPSRFRYESAPIRSQRRGGSADPSHLVSTAYVQPGSSPAA